MAEPDDTSFVELMAALRASLGKAPAPAKAKPAARASTAKPAARKKAS